MLRMSTQSTEVTDPSFNAEDILQIVIMKRHIAELVNQVSQQGSKWEKDLWVLHRPLLQSHCGICGKTHFLFQGQE